MSLDSGKREKERLVLDTTLTEELLQEGLIRDLIRIIQEQRKALGFIPQDKIGLILKVKDKQLKDVLEKYFSFLAQETGTNTLKIELTEDLVQPLKVNDALIELSLEKIH